MDDDEDDDDDDDDDDMVQDSEQVEGAQTRNVTAGSVRALKPTLSCTSIASALMDDLSEDDGAMAVATDTDKAHVETVEVLDSPQAVPGLLEERGARKRGLPHSAGAQNGPNVPRDCASPKA